MLCASVCSLITTLSGTFTDVDHRAYIAQHWIDLLDQSVRRIDAFRDAHPDHPVVDVAYADLVAEPLATVGAIYDAVGTPLTDTARSAVAAYVAGRPRRPFGEHHYQLAQFGLDADTLRGRFAGYIERYGVAPERSAV